jgi:ADP-L-glycero-D-manno-heptose 6-epimerase
MIVITGGSGFIGSTLANTLVDEEILIVDTFSNNFQHQLLNNSGNVRLINLSNCKEVLQFYKNNIKYFYHLGANSSTDQSNLSETVNLNIFWSQYFWDFCVNNEIPFVYASSAATYGDGSNGFSDTMTIDQLKNIKINGLYGWSKMYFDIFALNQASKKFAPPKWYGLKFFNVYGANEIHKGTQSSVIHPFLKQLIEYKKVYLFKSYVKNIQNGEQKRDFVSVNFCIEFIEKLLNLNSDNGIYNVGTGSPKTFIEFSKDIMNAAGIDGLIEYIDMPEKLKSHYQYFTKSENKKSSKIHKAMNKFHYKKDLNSILETLMKSYDDE